MRCRMIGARPLPLLLFTIISMLNLHSFAFAWYDGTHLAIAKAAGYKEWYNSAAADVAKTKAGNREGYNHYCNIPLCKTITINDVFDQIPKYNSSKDSQGHLYGAIIVSLNSYIKGKVNNKYSEYSLAYMAHYVGDLSQPLHNMDYNDFNKEMHLRCDGVIDDEVLDNIIEIKKYMYTIIIKEDTFQEDISYAICNIANESRSLARRLELEKRTLTKMEAYRQLGHSASLLRGILNFVHSCRLDKLIWKTGPSRNKIEIELSTDTR